MSDPRETVMEWIEARADDPQAPESDLLDASYDDADEGADDDERPITSVGGSERLIWLYHRFGRRNT